MNQTITDFIKQCKQFGIMVVNHCFEIKHLNNKVSSILSTEQLNQIIQVYKNNRTSFCLISPKCELEIIKSGKIFIFLFFFKDEGKFFLNLTFKQILNAFPDGISICDKHGYFVFINSADKKMAGIDPTGHHISSITKARAVDKSAKMLVFKEKKPVNIIQKYRNGKQFLVSSSPIFDKNGEIEFVVSITRDMTELKKLENEKKRLQEKQDQINKELQELKEMKIKLKKSHELIASDPKSVQVIERAMRVAQVDSTVFIQGETGVGKEGIVNLIHLNSSRKNEKLISINCGAIPEQLLESELFGYEPGAFTGANAKGKKGLFEIANKGTIFLDEIGEMSLSLQVKLLRVLQESEFTRIGGSKPIYTDVRIIAATNRDLLEMVNKGEFREDLYYRLNIVLIKIPPLRERREDIVPLMYHFLKKLNEKYGIERSFTPEVFTRFKTYDWPGNVRQLKNLIERICLMINKNEISFKDIQQELNDELEKKVNFKNIVVEKTEEQIKMDIKELIPLKQQVEEFEKKIIIESLKKFPSIRQTAKALKVDQSTLVRKIQKYGIRKEVSYT